MSKRENGLAVKEVTSEFRFTSATDLLQEWSKSLSNILEHERRATEDPGTINIGVILAPQACLYENIQRLILDEMMGRSGIRDKEQFIRMVQVMATKLLDSVSIAIENNPSLPKKEALLTFKQVLLQLIRFIQEFFGSYFDMNEKLPVFLVNVYRNEITRLGEQFSEKVNLSSEINPLLLYLLNKHFASEEWMSRRQYNYRHFSYEKELLTQLLKENKPTNLSVRSLLYYYNFNCSSFVIYEFDRLVEQVTQLSSKADKINMLRTELKNINQLPARVNYSFDEDMPSLKEQVSTWIEEEIKYCEAGHFMQIANAPGTDNENKIHTTLSVAKLGLLVRLLVVDKIIINRTIAPMLRTVAKTFTTLQREEISFGSLETKYHAPDKATIAVMKDILQKWLVILSKL